MPSCIPVQYQRNKCYTDGFLLSRRSFGMAASSAHQPEGSNPPKYKIDYAIRVAKCNDCGIGINRGTLRVGKRVKGIHGHWEWHYHHVTCLFSPFNILSMAFLQHIKSAEEIINFGNLETDHKKAIKEIMQNGVITDEMKQRGIVELLTRPVPKIEDYLIKLNNKTDVKCLNCQEIIEKKEMCVSKKSEKLIFHLKCFQTIKETLGYYKDVKYIPGYDKLYKNQCRIMGGLKRSQSDENLGVLKRTRAEVGLSDSQEGENKQTEMDQSLRIDKLKNILEGYERKYLHAILSANNQQMPSMKNECVNRLADAFAFGALDRCPECYDDDGRPEQGQLVLYEYGYKCTGYYNEDAKCQYVSQTPERSPVVIPAGDNFEPLRELELQVGKRLFPAPCPSPHEPADGEASPCAVAATARDLYEMQPSSPQAGPSHVEEMDSGYSTPMTRVIETHLVKGRGVVHPLSGLANEAHVYQDSDDVYSTVLLKIDVQDELNLCYCLQLLENDDGSGYCVFRAWGSVGLLVESRTKNENFADLNRAKDLFEKIFCEKTKQDWNSRDPNYKAAGSYRMSELYYGDHLEELSAAQPDTTADLADPVHKLVATICNIEPINQILCEYEVDPHLMPVGRLAAHQIEAGHDLLDQLLIHFESGGETDVEIIAHTNKFFELIPHNFGQRGPPLLKSKKLVYEKMAMLEQLRNFQCFYRVLQSGDSEQIVKTVEEKYRRLNTEIGVVPEDSRVFDLVVRYLNQSHAPLHNGYSLEVQQVFSVRRAGEAAQFARFRGLHRRLLWHGSRATCFAGILAEGMLISPFEAPRNGALFGSGLYFAEMVSKSANYCDHSREKPYGILMLCDVALGNMRRCVAERDDSAHSNRLTPKWLDDEAGTNSVWGVGKLGLEPAQYEDLDGARVPLGIPVPTTDYTTDLKHHEYVVSDVHQVNIKYLVCIKFNYIEN